MARWPSARLTRRSRWAAAGLMDTLFVQAGGVLERHLLSSPRSRRMMRRGRNSTTKGQPRGRIVDAVSISDRPEEVARRGRVGRSEGDWISGSRNSHIATLIERCSRFVKVVRVAGRQIGCTSAFPLHLCVPPRQAADVRDLHTERRAPSLRQAVSGQRHQRWVDVTYTHRIALMAGKAIRARVRWRASLHKCFERSVGKVIGSHLVSAVWWRSVDRPSRSQLEIASTYVSGVQLRNDTRV
jgi:hypothetical protein